MTILYIFLALYLTGGAVTLWLAWPSLRRAWGVVDGLVVVYVLTAVYALIVLALWPFLLREVVKGRLEW
jgi:hypothetical protein